MKLTKAQLVLAVLSGLLTWWILGRVMDRDIESAHASMQRQWLVVGLLLAGGYVVFRYRRIDREHYRPGNSREAVSKRYRMLGVVAWGFVITGSLMVLRLIL